MSNKKIKNVSVSAHTLGEENNLFPQSYASLKQKDRSRYITFHQELKRTSVEEDVKAAYRKFFSLPQDSSKHQDLYTAKMLFEFKYDKNFKNKRIRAEVLAQILYYVHRLKFDANSDPVPPYLCLADINETIVTETVKWQRFYNDNQYTWETAPSSPDAILIRDLEQSKELGETRVFNLFDLNELQILDDTFQRIFSNDIEQQLIVKRDITERNFEDVFVTWDSKFGEYVRNGIKPSRYFICDIQEGKSHPIVETGRVYFDLDDGITKNKKLNIREYLAFWELYNKNKSDNIDVIRGILSKADRLSEDSQRRFEGEFYTPVHLARKAIDYLDVTIGGEMKKIDWDSGKYRLWDMACGTGNLEYYLPSKAYQYCYMSTLHAQDVIFCKGMFHDATVFQYDYLNDDVERVIGQDISLGWKMPTELVNDLANPDIQWIIYINPPFGTAQNKKDASKSKEGISMTKVQQHMTNSHLGEVSRELFSQFLYRIHYEFKKKKAWLGLFSTLKYLNSNNDQKLRDSYFRYKYERGFIFEGNAFEGLAPGFPISFLIWNLSKWMLDFDKQTIIAEKCNKKGEAYAVKTLNIIDRKFLINKWVQRPPATIDFPPFSSALNINDGKKDLRARISKGFICSLCTPGNDMQHNNYVALFSGPYGSAGAYSVTKENFLKSMVIHAVRKTAKGDWSNDRDQFYKPYVEYFHDEVVRQLGYVEGETPEFPMDFARDCVVWSLFAPSNQTVALKDVDYKGKTYQIHNNLFPFTISQVKEWGIQDPDIAITILAENEDRFAAKWLTENYDALSQAAKDVIEAAKEVYRLYFHNLNFINTSHYKIKTWEAGRYQIINSMKEEGVEIGLEEIEKLEDKNRKLGEKIRERLYPLGFLR